MSSLLAWNSIGSGAGNVEEVILQKAPEANITCVEILPEMVEASKQRLLKYKERVKIVAADALDFQPTEIYDALVSNFEKESRHDYPLTLAQTMDLGGIAGFKVDVLLVHDTFALFCMIK